MSYQKGLFLATMGASVVLLGFTCWLVYLIGWVGLLFATVIYFASFLIGFLYCYDRYTKGLEQRIKKYEDDDDTLLALMKSHDN